MSLLKYIKENAAEYRQVPATEVGVNSHTVEFNGARISAFSLDYANKIRKCLSEIFMINRNIFRCSVELFIEDGAVKSTDNAYTDKEVIYIKGGLDEKKIKKVLVHELMHNCINQGRVLATDEIKQEFISKRKSLYAILYSNAKKKAQVKNLPWYDLNRNDRIIDFIENDIGYGLTSNLMYGIFPTINSIYSLDEYMCEIAEIIFFIDPSYAQNVCPRGYELVKTFLGIK